MKAELSQVHVPTFVHVSTFFCMGKVNSLWPCDTIYHHRTLLSLLQVMAWHLFVAKPLPEARLKLLSIGPSGTKIWIWIQNFSFSNAFENVLCKMSAIWFRPQCVKCCTRLCSSPTHRLWLRLVIGVTRPSGESPDELPRDGWSPWSLRMSLLGPVSLVMSSVIIPYRARLVILASLHLLTFVVDRMTLVYICRALRGPKLCVPTPLNGQWDPC